MTSSFTPLTPWTTKVLQPINGTLQPLCNHKVIFGLDAIGCPECQIWYTDARYVKEPKSTTASRGRK